MLRIIGSLSLFFVRPLSVLFYVIYILCGLSDILDGFVARKTNTVTKAGAALDSIADVIFVAIVLFIFIPILSFELWLLRWILLIAFIRLLSLIIGFIKYRAFAYLHTYANKATGVALFCFPILYHLTDLTITGLVLCSIASLSALEELIISINQKELNRNICGIFLRRNQNDIN